MKMSEVDAEHALVLKQFSQVMEVCRGGIDAFLFVIKANDRSTEEELKTIDIIFRYLGWNMLDYVIFVLTQKGDADEKSFQDWKERIFDFLQSRGYPKARVQNRFIFVDNKNPTAEQAIEILELVFWINTFNRGNPYTFLAYEAAQRELEEEKTRIKEQLERKLQEKIEERIKPIKEQHEAEINSLQFLIDEKEAEAAGMLENQLAEKMKLQDAVAALKAEKDQEVRSMEREVRCVREMLERDKIEAYERERKEMEETIKRLREEMRLIGENAAKLISGMLEANQHRAGQGVPFDDARTARLMVDALQAANRGTSCNIS